LGQCHVIDLCNSNSELNNIFGDGPHFIITSQNNIVPPDNIKIVRYITDIHADHRSSIQVIDIIKFALKSHINILQTTCQNMNINKDNRKIISAYYISDIFPPGKWTTSETLIVSNGKAITVGLGFVDNEMINSESTAMHDLAVGLICFEKVYFPLLSLNKVHELLGYELFWQLVDEDTLVFIKADALPCMIFPSEKTIINGDLGLVIPGTSETEPISVDEIIRRKLIPIPGVENKIEKLFSKLKQNVFTIEQKELDPVPHLVRGCLLHPEIRQLLGFSDSIIQSKIPKWLMFPTLRLAQIVHDAFICRYKKIPAIKIPYGSPTLIGTAFAMADAINWVDEAANYIVAGKHMIDIGKIIINNPEILKMIIKFRETKEAENIRNEILGCLEINEGSEFEISINAGMKKVLPTIMLENARERFSDLLFAEKQKITTPAIWINKNYSDELIKKWRKKSADIFRNYCKENNISKYDYCPCGSGEKYKFCCSKILENL
jgi:hypothetical protein